MQSEIIRFSVNGNVEVQHELFRPDNNQFNSIYIILPGLAIKPAYYSSFAKHLTTKGAAAMVVNYRGVALNREKHLEDKTITLYDWGNQDVGGAISWIRKEYPGVEIIGLGHSMGGYLFGFTNNIQYLSSINIICVPSGRLKDFEFKIRIQYGILSYFLLPFFRIFFRYAKYSAFGLGEDMPIGVMKEIISWSNSPDFMKSKLDKAAIHYERFKGSLKIYHMSDDPVAPRNAIEIYANYYTKANKELVTIEPKNVNSSAIGHFGFFKKRYQTSLWELI